MFLVRMVLVRFFQLKPIRTAASAEKKVTEFGINDIDFEFVCMCVCV